MIRPKKRVKSLMDLLLIEIILMILLINFEDALWIYKDFLELLQQIRIRIILIMEKVGILNGDGSNSNSNSFHIVYNNLNKIDH